MTMGEVINTTDHIILYTRPTSILYDMHTIVTSHHHF